MGLEVATYIADLVATNPLSSDAVGQGDDHLRLLKSALQTTFPNFGNRYARVVSGNVGYTILSSDNTALIDVPTPTAGTLTHTFSLPALSSITAGFYVDLASTANTGVSIFVAGAGASIEGAASLTLGPQIHARVYYNGTAWRVLQTPASSPSGQNIAINGGLSVSGAAHFNTTVSIGGALAVTGTVTISGTVALYGALTVSGAVSLFGSLTVSGAVHFKSTLSVVGATTLAGTLSVSGASHFNTTMSVGGVATFASTVTISGTCVLLSGQLSFPATQNASAGANVLDDYEEGAWTPTLTFTTPGNLSVAYSVRGGKYTKIGRCVTIALAVVTSTFTHTTASGSLNVTGLPFTPSLDGSVSPGALDWQGITKAGYTSIPWSAITGTTTTEFIASGSGLARSNVVASEMPTAGTVILYGTCVWTV